jgi:hypothetical protein
MELSEAHYNTPLVEIHKFIILLSQFSFFQHGHSGLPVVISGFLPADLLLNLRLLRRFTPPKKIGHFSAGRIEIASIAALLRNDMPGVILPDTAREAVARLAMTDGPSSCHCERF